MESFLQFEIDIILALQNIGSWLVAAMKGLTFLGNEDFFILIMPLLYWCLDSELGIRLGVMLLYSNGFTSAFKMSFHSPRPSWISKAVIPHVYESSFGLPSGHSTMAASVWGLLASSCKKGWAKVLAILVIFLIGFSRLVLGAHFLRDVLSGWLLGGLFLLVFLKLEKPVTGWLKNLNTKQKLFISLFATVILLLPALFTQRVHYYFDIPVEWINNAGYPIAPFSLDGVFTAAGTLFGFTSGVTLLEHYQKKFKIEGTFAQKALRYSLGLIGVLIIRYGLKLIFPDGDDVISQIFRMVRYGVVGLWVAFLAPVLFQKIKLAEPQA